MPQLGEMTVYRRLLYLDGEQILNALSGIRLPAVDEAVAEILASKSRDVGWSFAKGGKAFGVSGRSTTDLKREVKLRQIVHRALSALLVAIDPQIKRQGPSWNLGKARENDLVQIHGALVVHHSMAIAAALDEEEDSQSKRSPFGRFLDGFVWRPWRDPTPRSLRDEGFGQRFVALVHIDDPPAGAAAVAQQPETPALLLQLDSKDLLVEPDEFCRRATVVAQIDRKPATRDAHGGREAFVLREAHDRTIAEIVSVGPTEAYSRLELHGRQVRDADGKRVARSPSVAARANDALLLRPLCIWR